MKRLTRLFVVLSLFASVLVGASAARAAIVFSDFEAPTYTAGSNVSGVDGWIGTAGVVTNTAPEVLAGAQSFTFSSFGYVRRAFTGSPAFNDGTVFTALMRVGTGVNAGDYSEIYLSDNIAGAATPGGIRMTVSDATSGTFRLDYGASTLPTGVSFTKGDTYLIEMVVTFKSGAPDASYHAYATNLTTAGPQQDLGSTVFLGASGFTAANVAANGGFIPYSGAGSGGVTFDGLTYQPLPEPASLSILVFGGVMALRRRTRGC